METDQAVRHIVVQVQRGAGPVSLTIYVGAFLCAGAAFVDLDNDGWQDLAVVGDSASQTQIITSLPFIKMVPASGFKCVLLSDPGTPGTYGRRGSQPKHVLNPA